MVWRDPPRDNKCLGSVARNSEPLISQVFVVPAREDMEPRELEKKMFMLRKIATHTIPQAGVRFYISSLSTRTIVYKGQFDPCQVNIRQDFALIGWDHCGGHFLLCLYGS